MKTQIHPQCEQAQWNKQCISMMRLTLKMGYLCNLNGCGLVEWSYAPIAMS